MIAASLLALSGLHVLYSRLLLTESFYVLFLLAALLGSVTYLHRRSLGWLLATAVSASCLQLTKYNTDLYANYKYGGRHYVSRLESFQDRVVTRIPNALVYDLLENNLTLPELARLDTDRLFREQILSIAVFQLTADEARQALTRRATL